MKTILALSILFSLIALPTLGELTTQDLEEIRQIIKEGIKTEMNIINTKIDSLNTRLQNVETKIDGLDTRLWNVETGVAELRGRSIAISTIKDWGVAFCALGALIVSIIALRKTQPTTPQTTQDTPKTVPQ